MNLDSSNNKYISSLIYDNSANINNFNTVILIDSKIKKVDEFIKNTNPSTFSIIYSENSCKEELKTLFKSKFIKIDRLGIITYNSDIKNEKVFFDNKKIFIQDDLNENLEQYSENTQFLIELIKEYKIKNFDYLDYSILEYNIWDSFYQILVKETNVIVGSFSDGNGSLKYIGNNNNSPVLPSHPN